MLDLSTNQPFYAVTENHEFVVEDQLEDLERIAEEAGEVRFMGLSLSGFSHAALQGLVISLVKASGFLSYILEAKNYSQGK